MNKRTEVTQESSLKQPWQSPKVTFVGHIGDVIQGGRDKVSKVLDNED